MATLHEKTYALGKFAGKIKSGVCLLLTDVAIFRLSSTSPTALNIVGRNIEYVIDKGEPEVVTSLI